MSLAAVITISTVLVAAGCGSNQNQGGKTGPIKIGYSGAACEAFVFTAYEKGFFKEEGLDVELVKGDFDTLKEALATGKVDAASGMVMKWVKPFEQGIDVAFTAGIHTGCIQLLVPANSDIKSLTDLKGKVIGNNGMGDGPMVFALRALEKAGLNGSKDVQWRSYPTTELEGILDRGEVSAIVLPDPIAQMIIDKGKARRLISTTHDEPFKDEYCCMATISGKLLKQDQAKAAAITRALMKGAKYVAANPDEVAKLIVEKKYIPGNTELIAKLLKSYNYIPSVDGGERAVDLGVKEMKSVGVLDPNTNETELKKKIFIRLPDVQ
jgi:NitT/TauT family transport system substrate-binding protein